VRVKKLCHIHNLLKVNKNYIIYFNICKKSNKIKKTKIDFLNLLLTCSFQQKLYLNLYSNNTLMN
jgi:hypothetical protein